MTRNRTPAVLITAIIILLGGTFYGFKLITATATTTETPTCVERTIAVGEELTSNLVKVNVFNASERSGLANRVNINLQRRGFLGGAIGNSTSAAKPKVAAVLTDDPQDPVAKLVAAQFGPDVAMAPDDIAVDGGITVVLGKNYQKLAKKTRSIKVDRPVTVCILPVELH